MTRIRIFLIYPRDPRKSAAKLSEVYKIMPMKIGDPRPSFEGATDWLNELEQTADDYVAEQPTLVYFWATSCGICKENMPKLAELKAKYKDRGLRLVAIHMPRYEADTDLETVKATIAEHRIDDVCAVDNQHKLKVAFLNEQGWVPVYYLFDADHKLKSRAAGEFGIGVITGALEKMFPSEAAAA
jgi:thiol-disulfide isomerase/thioredoxin